MESTITYFIIITVVVFVLLTLSIILFFNFSQKRILKEKERNHQQKMDFQKEMLAKTIETQEEERSRIARELHDDLSSKLNVINMNIEILKMRNEYSSEEALLENISGALGESIERSRRISHELMPPILEKFGLAEALDDLARNISQAGVIKMSLEGKDVLENTSSKNKLHIFRIVQELCNNTLKHANAREITLKATRDSGNINLSYKDDGVGITEAQEKVGLGMMNIQSRVQLLSGHFQRIPMEKGVYYELIVPYEVQVNPG